LEETGLYPTQCLTISAAMNSVLRVGLNTKNEQTLIKI
jgi:hypothetical protein